ncbi:hypothetical protein ABBQ38_014911 [Trebouxia sp. C0009 RCD-2024]
MTVESRPQEQSEALSQTKQAYAEQPDAPQAPQQDVASLDGPALLGQVLEVLQTHEIDFDVPITKMVILAAWAGTSLENQPGNIVWTVDLHKHYTTFVEKHFVPHGAVPLIKFSREMQNTLGMFLMSKTPYKAPEGRGYIGIGFRDEH